jgi:hypothetical protein
MLVATRRLALLLMLAGLSRVPWLGLGRGEFATLPEGRGEVGSISK